MQNFAEYTNWDRWDTWDSRMVGISLLTKGHAINSFMGLVVIVKAYDVLWKCCI